MKEPFDPAGSIDWSTVSRDDMVAAVSSVLDAKHASGVFHGLAYVWLACALAAILALPLSQLPWAAGAATVTGLGLAWLGTWARNTRRKRDRTLAALATDHPSKS